MKETYDLAIEPKDKPLGKMINYKILPEHRLIVVCNWGKTPVEEVLHLRQNLRMNPDYSLSYDSILDVTHLKYQYTSEEIRRMSETNFETGLSPIKNAIIAPADVSYGMSRMFEMLTDGESPIETCVFRDATLALNWLDRKGIDIERIFEEIRGDLKKRTNRC